MKEKTCPPLGDYETYVAEFEDALTPAAFARYASAASRTVCALVGRAVLGMASDHHTGVLQTLREAVHWQIRFMRLRGTPEQSLQSLPSKESFGGYTVERRGEDRDGGGRVTVDGMEVCPMTLSVLRTGGVMRIWV